MLPDVSVVICTHNPRPDYLARVLGGLRSQTFRMDRWQLLLVDNDSRQKLSDHVDLTWHPQASHCREERLGLTPARLRGIAESNGLVLVFIDDDNVLEANYLERAWAIAGAWPMLGAWGAGQIVPQFDVDPPAWTRPYWPSLAVRDLRSDQWSNCSDERAVPYGAGLCVRRFVAEHYAKEVSKSPLRSGLDRRGTSLVSSGDLDLSFTACDVGLGTGVFSSLRVTHLIPPTRLTEDYLVRLHEAGSFSQAVLGACRGVAPIRPSWRRLLVDYARAYMSSRRQRRFRLAALKGQAKARSVLRGSGLS